MHELKVEKPGRKLERLVAMLERALAGSGATIEAPSRRLFDRDTGKPREHDVLLTWDHGHHQIITAIECRDRSRPIGVPDVEAFADKCAATGVNSGVMVSSKGFYASAKKKAGARSITCMELSEAEKFDWLGLDAIVGFQRQFSDINVQIMFQESMPAEIEAVYDTGGVELNKEAILQIVISNVPAAEEPENEVGKLFPVRMRVNTVNWTARDRQGRIWPIDHMLADTSFTTIKTVHPVEAHRYTGGGKDYAVASADAMIGQIAGRFMMIRNEDGSTSVYWTPEVGGSHEHGKG